MKIGTKNFTLAPMILSTLVVLFVLFGMTFDAGAAPPTVYADFNGDGFDDLAVGVPHEDIGTINAAGAVNVIYGSSRGLSSTALLPTTPDDQFWHQNSSGILDIAEDSDFFGDAVE